MTGDQPEVALSVPSLQPPSFTPPAWLGDALIWTAILTVAGTLAVGIVRHATEGENHETPRLPGPVVAEPPAQPSQPPADATPPQPEAAPPSAPGGPIRVPVARFGNRAEISGISVGVPSGWSPASGGGAVGMIASDGEGMLRVFSDAGPAPKDFAGGAARFLSREHPGARITKPRPVRIGSLRATLIRARYRGGTERAIVFEASGAAYLVMARTDGGAPVRTRDQTRRVLRSIRP